MPAVSYSIQQAVRIIASRCDGAREQDGAGFNGRDTHFGKSLAAIPHDNWSPKQLECAHRMLATYREQLSSVGVDYDAIRKPDVEFKARMATREQQAPTAPAKRATPSRITREETKNRWLLEFPFDAALVEKLRALGLKSFKDEASGRWLWPVYESKISEVLPLIGDFDGATDLLANREEKERILEANRRGSGAVKATQNLTITSKSGKKTRAYQEAGVEYALRAKRVLNADQMGLGKQQPVDAKVLTPSGWRCIGDLVVGDSVIGSNGSPTKVTGSFPQGVKPSYRVTFSDDSFVEAGPEHLWSIDYLKGGKRWSRLTLTTLQLLFRPVVGRLNLDKTPLYLPIMSAPAQFGEKALPIGSYTLGAIIANGGCSTGTPVLAYASWDWPKIKEWIEAEGTDLGNQRQYENVIHVTVRGVCETMRELGLNVVSGEKRIPRRYMLAGIAQRIALFHGLMDADGTISATQNRVTYCTTSQGLADDVRELVEGLGGIASVRSYDRSQENKPTEYQVRIRLPEKIPPFLSPRKASRYKPGSHASPKRTVRSVEYVRDVESVCISVAAEDRLYVTERCILTHNTIQGIATLILAKQWPALIVPPAGLKLNWKKELDEWAPGVRVEIIEKKKHVPSGDVEIYIANYDILTGEDLYMLVGMDRPITKAELKELNEERARKGVAKLKPRGHFVLDTVAAKLAALKLKSIIFDEFHYCKNEDSRRSKAAKALAKDVPYRIGFTGTPVENRPKELLHQLDILGWLAEFGGYMGFIKRYCAATETAYGWDDKGASNTQELHKRLRETCYIRRLKEEVLSELPPKIYARIPIELSNRSEYESAERDYLDWVADNEGAAAAERASRAEEITRLNGLMKIAAKGKIKGVREWVEGFLEAAEKLVLFAHHIEVQHELLGAFPGAVAIQGGAKPADTEEAKKRFYEDPSVNLIVCSIKAGGVGHNLHANGKCSSVALAEFPWTPAAQEQCEDRVHRMGQTAECVNVYELFAPGTVDEDTLELLDEKRKVVDAVTDGAERERRKAESVEAVLLERMKKKAKARKK